MKINIFDGTQPAENPSLVSFLGWKVECGDEIFLFLILQRIYSMYTHDYASRLDRLPNLLQCFFFFFWHFIHVGRLFYFLSLLLFARLNTFIMYSANIAFHACTTKLHCCNTFYHTESEEKWSGKFKRRIFGRKLLSGINKKKRNEHLHIDLSFVYVCVWHRPCVGKR